MPGLEALDRICMADGAESAYPARRQGGGVEHVFEGTAAHHLESERWLLGKRDRTGLEEYLDSVPGLEAAAEAEHELVVTSLGLRPEPVRGDRVGHHLDPGGLDALLLEPPLQRTRDGKDPAGGTEDDAFDRGGQIRMRKRAKAERLLAQRRVHLQHVRDPEHGGGLDARVAEERVPFIDRVGRKRASRF